MKSSLKVSCVQLDMKPLDVDYNFNHAVDMIESAMLDNPDVIVFPETWTTGFCPEQVADCCDEDGTCVKTLFSSLAMQMNVNIVAGSVANRKDGKVYNTSYVFNRQGELVSEYDKTHLFTPMNEHKFFTGGNSVSVFELDGVKCGVVICYDLRFPELIRTLALQGIEILFVVSQWPTSRVNHLHTLACARAIENQMFVVCCNSCGKTEADTFAGSSIVIDPWGNILSGAGESEEILNAELDMTSIEKIRNSINVFRDRKPDLYEY